MRIVGLGDSVAHGIGDDGEKFSGPGWSGRLAQGTMAIRHLNLSRPGARTLDVLKIQVPAALAFRPDLALIAIGGNDVLRADFNPLDIRTNLYQSIEQLKTICPNIIVLGLPDPWVTAPMPRLIRAALHRRTRVLNETLENVAAMSDIEYLDTWNDPVIYERSMWHVDHMHPSREGYIYLAERTSRIFGLRWHGEFLESASVAKVPHRLVWLLIYGTVWFLRRSVDLIPRLLVLALEEISASDSIARRNPPRVTLQMSNLSATNQ